MHKKPKVIYATFRKKKFRVIGKVSKRLQEEYDKDWTIGTCELRKEKNPVLFVDENLANEFELLDTTIHEALHATFEKLSEKSVEEGATDIARFLWRLGYRRINRDT
jgi:hypothetical protein